MGGFMNSVSDLFHFDFEMDPDPLRVITDPDLSSVSALLNIFLKKIVVLLFMG